MTYLSHGVVGQNVEDNLEGLCCVLVIDRWNLQHEDQNQEAQSEKHHDHRQPKREEERKIRQHNSFFIKDKKINSFYFISLQKFFSRTERKQMRSWRRRTRTCMQRASTPTRTGSSEAQRGPRGPKMLVIDVSQRRRKTNKQTNLKKTTTNTHVHTYTQTSLNPPTRHLERSEHDNNQQGSDQHQSKIPQEVGKPVHGALDAAHQLQMLGVVDALLFCGGNVKRHSHTRTKTHTHTLCEPHHAHTYTDTDTDTHTHTQTHTLLSLAPNSP